MATLTSETGTYVQQIGETAGVVWTTLKKNGPISLAKLVKQVDAPRDTVMLAVGWLAREEKITIEHKGRVRTVALR